VAPLKIALVSAVALLAAGAWILTPGADSVHAAGVATPVLVELFTSEGCSSCPPADRLLQKLDGQPLPGTEMVVLSEHVDYWNHIGWKDPYSSHFFSDRQSAYAKRFGLNSVYTPQMVVNGSRQFAGSNSELADKAFAQELGTPRISVHLSSISADASSNLRVHLEVGTLSSEFGSPAAEVYVAVALNRAESQVSAGENAGHKLAHVSVVKSLTRIGVLKQGQKLTQDIKVKVEPASDSRNLRLIAFVQEPHQGRVLGATVMLVRP
jgi:hypothetical protein